MLLFAFLTIGAFATAGAFSSKITTAVGQDVLFSSPNCGPINLTSLEDILMVAWPYVSSRVSLSSKYAQQCYTSPSPSGNC